MAEETSRNGSLASDLRALLESGAGADVTLVVGDSQLRAHSLVLAARSPVFAATLRSDMQEARSRRIEICDVPEAVMRQLLSFIYTDTAPQLETMAADLLAAANRYDLPLLKDMCEQQVARELTVENAAATAALADLYRCQRLSSAVAQFTARHPEVLATAGWAQLLRDNAAAAAGVCSQLAVALPRPPPAEAPGNSFGSLSSEEKDFRLIQAANEGAVGEVTALLAAGANVRARTEDEFRCTALHRAAMFGHVEVARCLLRAGADVYDRNSGQGTPLHSAAFCGHAAVVRLLLEEAPTSHEASDDRGRTPLHNAALTGRADAAAALIEAGASREATDSEGKTPLDLARQHNRHQHLIDMLS